MKIIFSQISGAIRNVIRIFFTTDLDVMSDEVRQILANPEDAKKYREAIKKIETGTESEVKIELSDKSELTLVP